jgi:hypothetical protein
MAYENPAKVIPFASPTRGMPTNLPPLWDAEENTHPYIQTAIASTANTAAPNTLQYAKLLQPFLKEDSLSEKERKMSDISREEIQAHIAASEARNETKIARLEGKLDLVLSKLDGVNENVKSSNANQWVIGLGLAVLIVAVVALFPVFFGMGSQIRDIVHTEVQSQVPAAPPAKKP